MPCAFDKLKRARDQGLKIVVVDPARTRTAAIAHLHLPIIPGTDGHLALAFIRYFAEQAQMTPDATASVG